MKGKNTEDSLRENAKRKHWSAAEKLRLVLAGWEPGVDVSDLRRRESLSPAQFLRARIGFFIAILLKFCFH